MLFFFSSSIVFEIPYDAYTTLSRNLIGCSALSREYRKLIGWYWKIMRRKLWTLTCPIKNVDLHKASLSRFVFFIYLLQILFGIPIDIYTAVSIVIITTATVIYAQYPVVNTPAADVLTSRSLSKSTSQLQTWYTLILLLCLKYSCSLHL